MYGNISTFRDEELENQRKLITANAYEMIYVREFEQFLESSKLIAVFHSNQLRYYQHRRVKIC